MGIIHGKKVFLSIGRLLTPTPLFSVRYKYQDQNL
jgi:hypothetical protein